MEIYPIVAHSLHQANARRWGCNAHELALAVKHDLLRSATQACIHIGIGRDHLQSLCLGLLFDCIRPVHSQMIAFDVPLGKFSDAELYVLSCFFVAGLLPTHGYRNRLLANRCACEVRILYAADQLARVGRHGLADGVDAASCCIGALPCLGVGSGRERQSG